MWVNCRANADRDHGSDVQTRLAQYNARMSKDDITKISGDGLRYKSKEGGSPFAASGTGASMSCYKCGLHKPRALGRRQALLPIYWITFIKFHI
jgi:hypothetical protein